MRIDTEELRIFQDHVRRFVEQEIVPNHRTWERDGAVPRELWLAAGKAGLLCTTVGEEYGGAGADYRAGAIVAHELARAGAEGPGFVIHSEMAVPYIEKHGTLEQKQLWLRKLVAGEAIAAVAMTEPSAGSDLRRIRTRASRKGQGYVLNGQKVFISNGQLADVMIVAAKTEGSERISLFLVDTSLPGFQRGKNLEKLGSHAQDTSEIFFDDVQLTEADLLGPVDGGLDLLKDGLVRERLTICVGCQARAESCLAMTVDYARQRQMFGQNLMSFQNTRFKLADVKADLMAGRALVDDILDRFLTGEVDIIEAAAAKLWTTEMLGRTADTCLQLHGGWGYMMDMAIGRAFVDARAQRLAGGSSEMMREIVGRAL